MVTADKAGRRTIHTLSSTWMRGVTFEKGRMDVRQTDERSITPSPLPPKKSSGRKKILELASDAQLGRTPRAHLTLHQGLTSRKECCRYLAQKALSRHLAAGKETLPIPWNTLATALANMGTSWCNGAEHKNREKRLFKESTLP